MKRQLAWMPRPPLTSFIALIVVSLASMNPAMAERIRRPSAEDLDRWRMEDLQKTELKIGPDCQPKSWATKLHLKTLNAEQRKYFWLGQRYAVMNEYRSAHESYRLLNSQSSADAEIEALQERIDAIERQKRLQQLAARDPEAARRMEELDRKSIRYADEVTRSMEASERARMAKLREWANRCYDYADSLSR